MTDSLDELQAKARQLDQLRHQLDADHDRAIAQARQAAADKARAEVRAETGGRLIRLAATEIAAGRIPADQLDRLVDNADVSRLLTADGDVNRDLLAGHIAALAGDTPPRRRTFPDLGQGRRGDSTATPGVEAGRTRYQQRNDRSARGAATGRDRYRQRHRR